MTPLLIFFGELFVLFLLSRAVSRSLSHLLYLLTRSQKITVYLLAFLFLPGTFIHEVAHYLTALLVFVPVGEMELIPKLEGTSVKLGSVQISKTDPLRHMLIGVAPFLFGTTILIFLLSYTSHQTNLPWYVLTGVIYVLFEISNTMFSSKKDMEGVIEFFITALILGVILFFLGIRPPHLDFHSLLPESITAIFRQGSFLLLIPLGLDITLILLANGIRRSLFKQ